MKPRKLLFIASLLTAVSSATFAAAEFSNFTLFGDSLSDIGNGPGAPFTNGGGALWVQDLSALLGLQPVVPSSKGGSDYAIAGDQTGPEPFGPTDGGQLVQVETFLAGQNFKINSHGLYSLWAGSNDIKNGLLAGATPTTIITNSNANIMAAAELLHKAGAKYIIVLNVPNLGATPIVRALGPATAAAFTTVSLAFDQTLNTKLNALGFPVIQPNAYGLLSFVQANPTMFGFRGPYTSVCDFNGQNCHNNNAINDIFFDGFHPSVAASHVLAGYIYSIFQGANDFGIMGEAPFAVVNGQNANIDSELLNIRTGTEYIPVGQFKTFFSGTYNPYDLNGNGSAQPGYDADNVGITAGIDYRLNENAVLGIAVGHSDSDIDFDDHGGNLDLRENMLSLFGGYQYRQAYATGELNFGIPMYGLDRNMQWGIAHLSNHGNTDGLQYGAAGTIGYNVIDTALKTGPYVDLSYQNVHVNGFSEAGVGSFADMNYESEFDQSLAGGIGWQIAYSGTTFYITLCTSCI
jgi:outer membrane lipase/esterase